MKKIKTIALLLIMLCTLPAVAQVDVIPTKEGAVTLTPILHSSMMLQWKGRTIFVDPYGGADNYAAFPKPDLVLITDIHGDHLHKETLKSLRLDKTTLIAPKAVMEQLKDIQFKEKIELANGEEVVWNKIPVRAIPMYNLPEDADARHPKGRGNGYVVELGGKRFYFAGDTEDIPEMRMLTGIDVAFVPMNLPYTMPVEQAADGVIAFKPAVVYPYHFRGAEGKFSDVEKFKQLVNEKDSKIDVRLRNWYPEAKAEKKK